MIITGFSPPLTGSYEHLILACLRLGLRITSHSHCIKKNVKADKILTIDSSVRVTGYLGML